MLSASLENGLDFSFQFRRLTIAAFNISLSSRFLCGNFAHCLELSPLTAAGVVLVLPGIEH